MTRHGGRRRIWWPAPAPLRSRLAGRGLQPFDRHAGAGFSLTPHDFLGALLEGGRAWVVRYVTVRCERSCVRQGGPSGRLRCSPVLRGPALVARTAPRAMHAAFAPDDEHIVGFIRLARTRADRFSLRPKAFLLPSSAARCASTEATSSTTSEVIQASAHASERKRPKARVAALRSKGHDDQPSRILRNRGNGSSPSCYASKLVTMIVIPRVECPPPATSV